MHENRVSSIRVQLENEEIWGEFHKFTLENIITKSGRRLFPEFKIWIDNLDPSLIYDICVDFIEHDRYEWIQNKWVKMHNVPSNTNGCNCECVRPQQAYFHNDSPNSGAFWMAQPVSFSRIKLTDCWNHSSTNQIILKPMYKYEPRIQVIQHQPLGLPNLLVHLQTFPIASFIAVTTYKNENVTALKIKLNPFARDFRINNDRKQERSETPPISLITEQRSF